MRKESFMSDEQVEQEIERLKKSEFVALAKKEESIRYKRRQCMYQLRCYEKKGRELARAGITIEMLEKQESDL